MNGETRLHMIFLLILILTTILVILLFSDGTTTEAFGNEISNIPSGTYGEGGDQGATSKDTPLSPMDPGAGYYAINVGTIDAPIWKRKAVPYGYRRDPADFTKLVGRTEAAIQGSTGGLTDADALAPPFLNIPGAEYTGGSPNYGAGIKPPASGFYKIQVYKKLDPEPSLALAKAKKNADLYKVAVAFIQKNILETNGLEQQFDIIVSNPPYVRNLEKAEIKQNVLANEPHLALFVEDNDALIFYRKIAELATKNLSAEGKLFFEINQYLGKETVELLENMHFKNSELRKDIYGNDRMIACNI